MNPSQAGQHEEALRKNAAFFADNDWYKSNQSRLETYRLIADAAAHEVESAQTLLDIGNGGVFIFPIDRVPHVEAVDVFVEESFSHRYPNVTWRAMNILDFDDQERFDTIVAINCLHHVVGSDVGQCYRNLARIFLVVFRALQPGGKLVLIESTVPAWFLKVYKPLYPFLLKVWPLSHPPTFQYNFREIHAAAVEAGFQRVELAWIPKIGNIMTLGFEVPGWVSPIRIGKFVYRKPQKLPPVS
ncbi:MAG TPA: class I SAM-dependent methyltransferase [Chthoniobacterales bacterium]|nr:class I SAM-dependent methyltransferase [Chthoniobacterales bacterium]